MLDLKSFSQTIQQLAEEKGIAQDKIFEIIEMALAAAYKRDYGKRGQIIRAKMEPATGKVDMKQIKIVVDEDMIKSEEEIKAEEEERMKQLEAKGEALAQERSSESEDRGRGKKEEEDEGLDEGEGKKIRFNPEKHIMLDEAKKIKEDVKSGDELEFPLEYHEEYGRIAAQTAKQVIIQRIREAEREAVYEDFKDKEGELVNGIVQRVEGRNVFIDIGRTGGVLPYEEQIPYERYHPGERIKVLVMAVEKNPKGPGVFLSRSHPRLLKKLFEIEVPEIASGTVEIKSVAREAGARSKVAVVSHEKGVDPVGSLVGQKGVRVSTVIHELGGEKIDVIEWSEDPSEFIAHSFSPAKVVNVEINEKRKEARVTVPEEQLSLAIGRGGQNVRLAAKLTGWKIDVRSDKIAKTVVSSGADSQAPEVSEAIPSKTETSEEKVLANEKEQFEQEKTKNSEEKLLEPKTTKKSKSKKKKES